MWESAPAGLTTSKASRCCYKPQRNGQCLSFAFFATSRCFTFLLNINVNTLPQSSKRELQCKIRKKNVLVQPPFTRLSLFNLATTPSSISDTVMAMRFSRYFHKPKWNHPYWQHFHVKQRTKHRYCFDMQVLFLKKKKKKQDYMLHGQCLPLKLDT